MPQSSRTFRIFVSSTFSDLKEERNALKGKVIPRLRELASSHRCCFRVFDLGSMKARKTRKGCILYG
jgi:hypothetical protein